MPRTMITKVLAEDRLDQIILTFGKDVDGDNTIRLRANMAVTLGDAIDPTITQDTVISLNELVGDFKPAIQKAVDDVKRAALFLMKEKMRDDVGSDPNPRRLQVGNN